MTKKEFQDKHGFADEDMERIGWLVTIYGGYITEIKEKAPINKASG